MFLSTTEAATVYFTKYTGKHLCQSLFFNKVAGLSHWTCSVKKGVLKNFTNTGVSHEFCEILKNTIFTEYLRTTASSTSSKKSI